jgi:hypothetical protein
MRFPRPLRRSREHVDRHGGPSRAAASYLLEKALEQVKELANQKPEDSPLAAAPKEVSRL